MTLEDSVLPRKQCKNCQRWLEKTAFPPGRAYCKKCYLARRKELDVARRSTLQRYHITLEIHKIMYDDQRGKCYLCGEEKDPRGHGGLVIDHDKDTGHVRGLLCRQCNANFIDEYRKLPPECKDFQRANELLRRGETGDYIESVRQRAASADQA